MDKIKVVWVVAWCLLSGMTFGESDSYRLSWRSNPATSMVIGWNQASGTSPEVFYGTEDCGEQAKKYKHHQKPDRVVEYRGMTNHFARLENLKPDTAYYFVVRDSEGIGRRLWFRTAPAKPQPFTFIAGGDSRTNPEPRRQGNALVAKLRPLFVLFGGDYTTAGKAEQWQEWFSDWQLTISEDGRMYPIIATHGNHENADLQMMDKLFDTPNTNQYYSMGIAGELMRIWVLNSELASRDPEKEPGQQAWIESDLPHYPDTTWKVATYHRPMRPHTAKKAEGVGRVNAWAQLFYDNEVDLVVESDTHMVKRTYPLRPFDGEGSYESFIRDDKRGMVFIGEGSWGAPNRPPNDDKPWTMASDSFFQFKWIQVFPKEMLIRTVKYDHADTVVPLTEENRFDVPENMEFWEPESGPILRLPFDAKHSTYSVPTKPTPYPLPVVSPGKPEGARAEPAESASSPRFDFNTAGDFEGWDGKIKFIENVAVANGFLSGQAESGQGKLERRELSIDGAKFKRVVVRMKSGGKADQLTLRWGTAASPKLDNEKMAVAKYKPGVWEEVVIDLSDDSGWAGQTITTLRIQPCKQSDHFDIDWIRFE